MNARQLQILIRQSFQAERWAKSVMADVRPEFLLAMSRVRDIVGQLPSEGLFRESEWRRAYLPQVEAAVKPYTDALAESVVGGMVQAGPDFEIEAINQLKAVGLIDNSLPPALLAAPTANFTRLALSSEVVEGTSLMELFGLKEGQTPATTPPFTRSQVRVINQKVSAGIMAGTSTEQIAKDIAGAVPAPGRFRRIQVAKGTAAHEIQSWALAIARTGIQDMNRQVNEQVWEANPIEGDEWVYEWVSAMDPRVCPVCAPLDGKTRPNRSDFPQWPLHFNCRCTVVLINKDEKEDVRVGIEVSDSEPTYKGRKISELKGAERREALASGLYATKKKVKGQPMYRRTQRIFAQGRQRRPSYGDYVVQSTDETQAMFFGGGNAGEERAQNFRQWIAAGKTPQQALSKVIINMPTRTGPIKRIDPRDVRFRPISELLTPDSN